MSKKLLSLTVRGTHRLWGFHVYGDPSHLAEWRADGLEIDEVENVIPAWIWHIGLGRPWCFFQDIFHLKNPFR